MTTTTTTKRRRDGSDVQELEVDVSAPEPPSKKAKRKAKKQGQAASVVAETATSTTSQLRTTAPTAPVPPDRKRSGTGIWIGNLPFRISKDDLRRFLTSNSSAIADEDITRVYLPVTAPLKGRTSGSGNGGADGNSSNGGKDKNVSSPNKGFAYVDFASTEALKGALALSEKLLSGRRVLIKNANSFEGRPKKSSTDAAPGRAPLKEESSRRIFVGNLGFDITKEALTEHFEVCGTVRHVHMATFEDTGKCKGFAWVEFDEETAAQMAVRGWINAPKADTEDDEDECPTSEEDDERPVEVQKKKKKKRGVKQWVNRIKGRQLRMEFAEDPSLRYQKRFGKGAIPSGPTNAEVQEIGAGVDAAVEAPLGARGVEESGSLPVKAVHGRVVEEKRSRGRPGHEPTVNAQTGAMTGFKGTKIKFD
ncbi:MAG: hypothetical protein M1826_006406 [Phylliscum demangeonii]|nr:MAG: hypothetical protein M1826_006406 [Phylliscum demangeonii]